MSSKHEKFSPEMIAQFREAFSICNKKIDF